eukprot:TRINITY_DN32905_c0_g1_i1.p1 TRINITY_DN32905_c0_g1~~TRINITY_DN32905_c0_g1_i1.p1  ORF type:complete len:771 (+),score=312.17 TRINITY_DN32905_c0_g1_i1:36-2315(+)
MALHYRHTAAQVARQLQAGKPLAEVLLDRARGHVVSSKDPVTGGHHCAIGGGPYDFLVSSTLASQAPQAVGRSLGQGLASQLRVPSLLKPDAVSLVSVGDGSVNHAQYLAAINIAEYAQHRNFKCPLVFTVSDNGIAISLKGYDWLQKEYVKKLRMKSFEADGRDMGAVFSQTKAAALYSRTTGRPSFLLYKNLPRRFGHAATDRQTAYLSPDEINGAAVENPLAYAAAQAVQAGAVTYAELHEMYTTTWAECRKAFDEAVNEPKVTERSVVQATTSQPLWEPEEPPARLARLPPNEANGDHAPKDLHVMRKHMTRVFDEILAEQSDVVYVGEDVEHGGYYLVTDGLAKKYPHRVKDFPPEESALMGLGIGYAQIGFVPVVEIPYAKYLDCGVDQFFEAGLMNWLSHGRQPCGMVIRLQGFDRGVFGGNFHTHNMLHLPPGIDVVCYSNGPEYARGMRHCVKQARAGRVVMSVDCTNLLNSKHLDPQDRDGLWEMPYTKAGDIASFDEVTVYGPPDATTAVVTYGNGVITSIAAAREMEEKYGIDVKVIDCPYLSGIPEGLLEAMQGVDAVVFADICKFGQHPFGAHIGNSKHLDPQDRDGLWEMPYTKAGDIASFDEVTVYGPPDATTAVVTYGNGVITSIAAAREMEEKYGIDVKVIDCPYLSGIPEGLLEAMQGVDAVVFADICKFGQHPFGAHIGSLKFRDLLPDRWQVCAAQPTYNPLGTYLTFLNVPDVTHAIKHVLGIEKFMTSAEMPSMIQ